MKLVLFLLSYLTLAFSLSCKRDKDCKGVSDDEDFVQCVASKCTCKSAQGFVGNATVFGKCSCPSPARVHWVTPDDDDHDDHHKEKEDLKRKHRQRAQVYCIDLPGAIQAVEQKRKEDAHAKVIEGLYAALIWPTPSVLIHQLINNETTGGLWDLVDDNAIGRVDPLGEFDTKDGVIEYFVGTVWLPTTRISKTVINKILAEGNLVSISAVLTFELYDPNPPGEMFLAYNLTQSGFFTFNEKEEISSMDLVIHNVGFSPGGQVPPNVIQSTCSQILDLAKCNSTHDPQGYYKDIKDCEDFMATIEIGTWDNLRANTVVCRSFHSLLAMARPEMHCPHAGRTGIGHDGHRYCTPHNYSDYYNTQY